MAHPTSNLPPTTSETAATAAFSYLLAILLAKTLTYASLQKSRSLKDPMVAKEYTPDMTKAMTSFAPTLLRKIKAALLSSPKQTPNTGTSKPHNATVPMSSAVSSFQDPNPRPS
jgi:hypothetical protein